MFTRLASALLFRRLARDLADIAAALGRQTALLERLADRYAPKDPPTERREVREDTGISHLDPTDAELALAYIERTQRDTGHLPDDEEVLIYLADEKTQDLHQRLVAREAEMARLREAREW
jgi:hypothetical protein